MADGDVLQVQGGHQVLAPLASLPPDPAEAPDGQVPTTVAGAYALAPTGFIVSTTDPGLEQTPEVGTVWCNPATGPGFDTAEWRRWDADPDWGPVFLSLAVDGTVTLGETAVVIAPDGTVTIGALDCTVAMTPSGALVLAASGTTATLDPSGAFAAANPAGSMTFGADGSFTIAIVGGATVTVAADDTITLKPNAGVSGLTLMPDGTIKAGEGDTLTIGADFSFVVNGNVVKLNLPTSDPAVAGALWNDTGTVKVSAG